MSPECAGCGGSPAPAVVILSDRTGGLATPAELDTGAPFTVERSYKVLPGSGDFALAYYASVDDLFGNGDDPFLGREAITKTASGRYTGTSPPLTLTRAGTQRIFAVRKQSDADGREAPSAIESGLITVTGSTDLTVDDGDAGFRQRGTWHRAERDVRTGGT